MMTERLVKWIGQQALKRAFTAYCDETGVVEGRPPSATCQRASRPSLRDTEWMGIDEIHHQQAALRRLKHQGTTPSWTISTTGTRHGG